MKILFTTLLCLWVNWSVWAQQPKNAKIDSLERIIATTKVDTVKGRSLCRLCNEYSQMSDYETARKDGERGLKISESQKDPMGIALCLLNLGNADYSQSNFSKALECYEKSLKIREQIEDRYGISSCISNIGNVYYAQDNYPKALECYQKSLKIREQIEDQQGIASCFGNIGNIYVEQGNYPKALDYYQKGLKIYEKTGNLHYIAISLDNIGGIYSYQSNHAKALEYHQKSLAIHKQIKNEHGVANTMLNIALIYDQQGKIIEAFDYHLKSLKIYEKIGDQMGTALCLNNLAGFYKDQGNYPKALEFFLKSLEIREKIEDAMGIGECWTNIGLIYIKLNNPILAKTYAQKGLKMAQQVKNLIHMKRSAEALYFADSVLGNYKDAIGWYKLFKQYSDSLNNNAKASEFGRFEAQYEYQKEQELQQQKEWERRMRMNYTFGGIVGIVLMFSGFIYYRYRTKSKLNRLLRTKNNELAAQRDELAIKNEEISAQRDELSAQSDQLAAQRDQLDQAYHHLKELDEFKEAMSGMIVHDLKNPLSAIIGISNKDHISKNDQTAIRQAGKQMLNLTLNILDVQKFEQAEVRLNRRDEALTEIVQDAFDQVSLLASNKNQQLSISFEPTTGVNADFELISRVLMNLLTNAIKYTPNNGKITIGAEEMPDNQVKISVADTGQGIPADKLDSVFDKFSQVEAKKSGGARSTGLGLTFCKMTVEAHGGRIWVESVVGVGTIFYFTLAKAVAEIKAVETIIIPHYEQRQISLTEEDLKILTPFLENLRKLDVYEAGDVLKILAQIPDAPNLAAWKSEMESTLFASNQERYAELVQMA